MNGERKNKWKYLTFSGNMTVPIEIRRIFNLNGQE